MHHTRRLALALTTSLAAAVPAIAQPADFSDMVKEVGPAVVNITVSTAPGVAFLPPLGREEGEGRGMPSGQGAGFFIDAGGILVTNHHVIEGADSVEVEMSDGRVLDASIIGSDPLTDIAVLDVEGEGFPTVAFADSDTVEVGDWALAVGNPLGQGFSVSLGIVSARGRTLSGAFDDYIQTDAAINRGNSGGPLFNAEGEVIGVNTAILSPTGGSIGIGFAMASNVVQDVVDQIRTYGSTRRGWIGVQIQPVTPDIAEALDMDAESGVLIAGLLEGPAQEAGVQVGDVVVAVDGVPLTSPNDLTRAAAAAGPGEELALTVMREGEEITLTIVLERREEMEARIAENGQGDGDALWSQGGARLLMGALDEGTRERLDLPEGVQGALVRQAEGSAAGRLEVDDVIVGVNQRPTATPMDVRNALGRLAEGGRPSALLQVLRDGQPGFVVLPLR